VLAAGVLPPGGLQKYASLDENPSRDFWYGKRLDFMRAHRPDAVRTLKDIHAIEDLEKQAALLDRLDSEVCFRAHGVPDAYLTVFGTREKPEHPRFDDATLEKVASVLGEDVADSLKSGHPDRLNEEQRRVVNLISEE
jgi:hypothetical protein